MCPSCRRSVEHATEPAIAPVQLAPVSSNPYTAPAEVNPFAETQVGKAKEPFSLQAAKFSAYAPFILFLMGTCLQGRVRALEGEDVGRQVALVLGSLSFFTTLAALILGLVGMVGGISRSSVKTIVYSIVGILLNAGLVTLWVITIIAVLRRAA
jgi:hypothetical protein